MSFAKAFIHAAAEDSEKAAKLLVQRAKDKRLSMKLDAMLAFSELQKTENFYSVSTSCESQPREKDPVANTQGETLKTCFKKVVEQELSTVASVYIKDKGEYSDSGKEIHVFNGVDGNKKTEAAIEAAYEEIKEEQTREDAQFLTMGSDPSGMRKLVDSFFWQPARRYHYSLSPV